MSQGDYNDTKCVGDPEIDWRKLLGICMMAREHSSATNKAAIKYLIINKEFRTKVLKHITEH